MFRFVDVAVALCEEAGEEIGCWAGEGVSEDDAEEGGEGEEADGFGVEEVGWWSEELGGLG